MDFADDACILSDNEESCPGRNRLDHYLQIINKRKMSFAELGSPGMGTNSTGGRPDPDRLMALLRDYEASGRNPNVDGVPDDMQVLQCVCEHVAVPAVSSAEPGNTHIHACRE